MKAETTDKNSGSLSSLRRRSFNLKAFLHDHCPYLYRWDSLFYFGLFLVIVGFLWMAAGLVSNSFSSAYNWDYSHQYLPFAYDYWQIWNTFFSTGRFPLYDPVVFIGNDNIGSNAYYGLFDPFVVILAFFPRAWIPQMFAIMTVAKLTITGLAARAYLRYLGRKEWTARMGALAWALSGYFSFFIGFPSFVSALTYVPVILLGIEKTIDEGKIGYLVVGLFLLSISCFMLLVPMCIWGVIYALWRFFTTIKKRKAYESGRAMLLGIAGFALGLMLGAFALLPSLRQSTLTGRASSIGSAYAKVLLGSLKDLDVKTFLTYLFEEVGDNPGRELMGLVSFFFPTAGFQTLPLIVGESFVYDSWTSSIFCYTPFIILFFAGILISISRRRVDHLLAILGGVFLLFTTFAYYAFFAFSGNGYGRWFFVLIPEIIAYGCWAFDQRKEVSKYVYLAGGILSLVGTIVTYFAIFWLLEGRTFTSVNGITYFIREYLLPDETSFEGLNRTYYLYYQIALVVIEGVVIFFANRKKWLPHALLMMIAVEAIIMGNSAYCFISTWSIENYFMGGSTSLKENLQMADNIRDYEKGFYRAAFDSATGVDNYQYTMATPEASSFHSLLNFECEDFAILNGMKGRSYYQKTYGDEEYLNPGWTANYRSKRWGVDTALGFRYYIIQNENGRSNKTVWAGVNVPFGAVEMPDLTMNGNFYKVYRVEEEALPSLGHAVDKDWLVQFDKDDNGNSSLYFSSTIGTRARTAYIEARGAIFDDDFVLPEGFEYRSLPSASGSALDANFGIKSYSDFQVELYTPNEGDYLLPADEAPYGYNYVKDGNLAAYILNHYDKKENFNFTSGSVTTGSDHLVYSPRGKKYFNEDPNGAYFEIKYYNGYYASNAAEYDYMPRIVLVGDKVDEDGNILENQVLGYDGKGLTNVAGIDKNSSTYSCLGLYAYGRVKQVMLVFPEKTSNNVPKEMKLSPGALSFTVMEREDIEAIQAQNHETRLLDVEKDINHYTFKTNYAEPQIVVTQLGYDAGWSCTATLPDGSTYSCPMYKLDGGLLGFYAPEGLISYKLSYFTPSLDIGLAMGGISLFFTTGYFLFGYVRKRRRHFGITVFDY